jgi:O-acetyl-ADP-ribose deacetylase (regulator of RNase III)
MKTIDGDLLEIKDGIICHQVNCKGVAGGGLAKQIRDKYPDWYKNYVDLCKFNKYSLLGCCDFFIDDSEKTKPANIIIASLFAQDEYGTDKRYTNYEHFVRAMFNLKNNKEKYEILEGREYKVYFPYLIGCGLGGGDWILISHLIEHVLPEVIIVKRE